MPAKIVLCGFFSVAGGDPMWWGRRGCSKEPVAPDCSKAGQPCFNQIITKTCILFKPEGKRNWT